MYNWETSRKSLSHWIEVSGPYQYVVFSSRTRLARNLMIFRFRKLDGEGQKSC